jgi:hypothetical protein
MRCAVCGEAALEFAPDAGSVERAYPPHGLDRLSLAVHDEAGHCVLQHLRNRAILERNDGSSAGHRLDHHQSEGLAPRDRKDEACGFAQEFLLLVLADLAEQKMLQDGEQGRLHALEKESHRATLWVFE